MAITNLSKAAGFWDWAIANLGTAPSLSMPNSTLVSAGAGALTGNWGGWSQATANRRPTVVNNVINSLPVLNFDGLNDNTGDYIEAASNYQHQFLIFVYRFNNSSSVTTDIKKWIFAHPSTYNYSSTDSFIGDGNMHAFLRHSGGIKLDGNTAEDPTARNWPVNTNFHIAAFKATGTVETQRLGGNDRGNVRAFDGQVAELYGFAAPPTDADIARLEGFFAHKFALTGNLPSGHAYKTVKPLTKTLHQGKYVSVA